MFFNFLWCEKDDIQVLYQRNNGIICFFLYTKQDFV